jgi:hypothetical protein
VAEDCGFNHLGLFNTCFKRRFGTSPGQWRKAAIGVDSAVAEKPDGMTACPLHVSGLCPWSGKLEGPPPVNLGVATARQAEPETLSEKRSRKKPVPGMILPFNPKRNTLAAEA